MRIKKLFVLSLALMVVALPACLRSDVEQMGTSNYTSIDNAFSGSIAIGDGSPSVAQDGEDLYVEDQFEVDGEARFDGAIDANSTVDFSAQVSVNQTPTADEYTQLVMGEWTTGAAMTSGGSNGIYVISSPDHDVSNAYGLRARTDLRTAAAAVDVNQLHAIDGLINLNETQTYTLTDNISVVGAAIHGGTSGDVIGDAEADPGSMNLFYGAYGPTATVDHTIQTNGVLIKTHNATYVDYGVQIESSSDMDAGLYLNSHASNGTAKMDVGVEMTSGASDMVYGIDMEAASFTGADIVGDNGETLDNGTDTAWVIGGFLAYTEGAVIDLSNGGTITPVATYQPITNDSGGQITTSASTAIADGVVAGQILILINEDAQDIVIKDAANTAIGGDITLTGGALDSLMLIWDGADWAGLAMHDN